MTDAFHRANESYERDELHAVHDTRVPVHDRGPVLPRRQATRSRSWSPSYHPARAHEIGLGVSRELVPALKRAAWSTYVGPRPSSGRRRETRSLPLDPVLGSSTSEESGATRAGSGAERLSRRNVVPSGNPRSNRNDGRETLGNPHYEVNLIHLVRRNLRDFRLLSVEIAPGICTYHERSRGRLRSYRRPAAARRSPPGRRRSACAGSRPGR